MVYADNGIVDPWITSNVILQNTTQLCPLIAVQPIYTHPYTIAKMISTYAYLYGRQIHLNMLAGGFKNDLIALGDDTPHDERYVRLAEYTNIITELLSSENPVSLEGKYYSIKNARVLPTMPEELMPGLLISGSSDAGRECALKIGATAVKYPQRVGDEAGVDMADELNYGVRVGIIARDTSEEAWEVAHNRFPTDRKGQVTHQLAMKTSDSQWHKQLSEIT